jgi:transcriptional regulator with XRE-family HTH domain
MDLGGAIKDFRKKKGLNQKELAELSDITQTYLSQIETNQRDPNLSTLRVISERLELPLPILFFLSMTEDDVDPSKRDVFRPIYAGVKAMLSEFFVI